MNLSFRPQNIAPEDKPIQIVLASQSIGRRMLLEKLGLRFRTVVTNVDEDTITASDPFKTIKKRATAKAEEIVNHPRVYAIPEDGKTLIIAADSMAVIGKKTYGKATTKGETTTMVKALMGKTHVFTTAVTMIWVEFGKIKKTWENITKTKVTTRKLQPAELDSYVARYDFNRFAASYALNETPWDWVTKIEGSYTNVIGLPFEVLLPILRKTKIIA